MANIGRAITSFIAAIIIARTLGPAGRGQWAFITGTTQLAVMISGLGILNAIQYARAQRNRSAEELYSAAAVASLLAGVVGGFVFAILFVSTRDSLFSGVTDAQAIWVGVLIVPLLLLNNWTGVSYLDDRVLEFSLSSLFCGLLFVAGVGIASLTNSLTVSFLITLWAITSLLPVLTVVRRRRLRKTPELGATVAILLRYGLLAALTSISMTLTWRLDLVFVKSYRGFDELGFYAAAVSLAEVISLVAVSFRVALAPRLGSPDNRAGLVESVCLVSRLVVFGGLLVTVVFELLSPPIVKTLFGNEFAPAVPALRLLVPGVILLAIHGPLIDFLLSEGKVLVTTVVCVFALLLNAIMNMVLLQHHTFVAAAFTSTVTYAVVAVLALVVFCRETHASAASVLVARKKDFEIAWASLNKLRSLAR